MVVERVNPSGGQPIKSPAYEMTKDGFMFLVMGFTGKAAAQIKETYINAFNFMVEKLRPKPYGLRELPPATPKFLTTAMLRHIQKRVSWLSFNQVGSTHAGLGKLIKDTFNVHNRDMIPIEKYAEVCTLLGCEPNEKALQGDLLEPAKVEYQPPAGMVLIDVAELEALRQKAIVLPEPMRDDEVKLTAKRFMELEKTALMLQLNDLKFVVEQAGGLVLFKEDVDKMKDVLKA